MPKPKPDEAVSEYLARFMRNPHSQKFPEDQRAAIAYHMWESARGEHEERDEQALPDPAERYEQFALEPPRIDYEKGEMYGVRVMGTKSAHGYIYSLDAQRAIIGRYEQMPIGLSHDYTGKPVRVPEAWGVLFNPRVDDKGTLADVKYLKRHEQTPTILEDAERNIGIFSMSPVTTACVQRGDTVTAFVPVRCDLVVKSATNKTLFEQATPSTDPVDPTHALYEQLDALKTELAKRPTSDVVLALEARVARFEQQLAAHNTYIEPKQMVETAIQKTAAAFDLSKFWSSDPAIQPNNKD